MKNESTQPQSQSNKTNFEEWYQTVPPWDIGRPQKVFIELEKQNSLKGKILDVGCGTGENALFLAEKGYEVWGVDSSKTAIAKAIEKASQRELSVKLLIKDALKLEELGNIFDVAIDCGLFHCFSDEDRAIFVEQLYKTLTPNGFYFFLCFSEQEVREGGPRRISREDIKRTFSSGWKTLDIKEATFENTLHPGGSRGYFVSLQKV